MLPFMRVDNHSMQTEQHFMTKLLDITQLTVFLQGWGIMRERIKQTYVCETANAYRAMTNLKVRKILVQSFLPKGTLVYSVYTM